MPGILILGGISAATSIIGAHKNANAQKDAAKIQSAAADRIAPIQQGVYQQQMSGMEPYAALGRQQANTMMRMMTPGVPYTPQMQLADARSQQAALPSWSMTPGQPPSYETATARVGSNTAAPPRIGGPPAPGATKQGTLGALAQQMVPMRAPNGSVRAIPMEQVSEFMRKGAVRV